MTNPRCAPGSGRVILPEYGGDSLACGLDRRSEPDQEAGKHRHAEREDQYGAIQPGIDGEGYRGPHLDACDDLDQENRQIHAQGATNQGEPNTLHQETANQSAPARPERQVDRKFVSPRFRPRHEHARQVKAREEQEDCQRARGQCRKGDDDSVDGGVNGGREGGYDFDSMVAIVCRVGGPEVVGERPDNQLRIGYRHVIRQSADDLETSEAAHLQAARAAEGDPAGIRGVHPQFGPGRGKRPPEAGHHHPDDRVRESVQPYGPTHDPGVPVELPAPCVVAQHNRGVAVGRRVVAGAEHPPQLGIDAHYLEVGPGYEFVVRTVMHSGPVLQADHVSRRPRHTVERIAGGALQLAKGGIGEGAEVGFMAHQANVHQFLGLGVRGGAQDERLDDAEEGRVCADRDGKENHGYRGEGGCRAHSLPTRLGVLEQFPGPIGRGSPSLHGFRSGVCGHSTLSAEGRSRTMGPRCSRRRRPA